MSGFVLTDRRLLFRDGGTKPAALSLEEVGAPRKASLPGFLGKARLGASGRHTLFSPRADRVCAVLTDMAAASDATGGPYRSAAEERDEPLEDYARRVGLSDPRVELLGSLAQHIARTVSADTGADLTRRVEILARTLVWGRGQTAGHRLSPLRFDDLLDGVILILGSPNDRYGFGAATTLVYGTDEPRKADAGVQVLAFLALGLVGYFIARNANRSPPPPTEVEIAQVGSMSGLSVSQPKGAQGPARAWDQLLSALPVLEAQVLLLRAVYGWDAPLSDLLQTRPDEVAARIHGVTGQPGDAVESFARGGP